jgi:hypothetical protein
LHAENSQWPGTGLGRAFLLSTAHWLGFVNDGAAILNMGFVKNCKHWPLSQGGGTKLRNVKLALCLCIRRRMVERNIPGPEVFLFLANMSGQSFGRDGVATGANEMPRE